MVLRCPSTSKAVSEQAKLLGCNDTYRYHCLRTEDGDLIEKCLDISWIQKGNCAIFNSNAQQVDAVKCNENLGICPQKQYLSNEVMSYSACVQAPDVHVSSFVPTENIKGESITTSKPPSDVSDDQPLIWMFIGAAILVVIVAIVVTFVMIIKRRKRSSPDSKEHHDEETAPLHNLTESNKDSCGAKGVNDYVEVPYYKTKTYEHLEKRLIKSAVSIIVIGEPGSGKSVLGEMLQTRFGKHKINGKYHIARFLNRLEDIDNYPSHDNTKTVNILDNGFEIWNHYPHLITSSFKEIQCFHEKVVKGEGNCLVITISKMNFENNLDAAQRAQLKSTEQLEIVDLSSKDYHLDITDKVGILEYHRKKKELTARRVDDTALRKATDSVANYVLGNSPTLEFEFPLSCHLYYKHDSFEENQEIFFSMTRKIIREFVEGLSTGSHEEKCQYCTLMYVALCGGQIQAKKKQDVTLFEGIAEVLKIDTSELKFNYGCCLITKQKKNNTYEIIHEEICKFLFSMFGERYTGMVIDKCEVEVLMKFLRTEDKSRHNVYRKMGFLLITHNLYDRLAARLQGIYNRDQTHAIFRDSDFCRQFKNEGTGTKAGKAGCAKKTTTEFSH